MRKELLLNKESIEELELYQTQLALLCSRFNNSIDEFDILRWLKNFAQEDRHNALDVLKMVEYVDDSQIIEGFDYCIGKMFENFPPKNYKFVLMQVGKYGKSGSAMMYFLSKGKTFSKYNGRFEVYAKPSDFISAYKERKKYVYVFIDDYFGTGGSVKKFYDNQLVDLPKIQDIPKCWIGLFAHSESISNITRIAPNSRVLYWKRREKVFMRNKSPFGRRSTDLRKLFYKYGYLLDKEGPLGYGNTQGMVTFAYGSPNNLLPIFWSSKCFADGSCWYPIFPRFSKDRIDRAKEFRKETAFWLSLARIHRNENISVLVSGKGENKLNEKYAYILKKDLLLFCVIRLLNQRRHETVIQMILGLSSEDYKDIINDGQTRGVLDKEGNLSEYGRRAYQRLSRMIIELKMETEGSTLSSNKLYVPHTFRGIT
ncbi:hypothetical protein M670_02808 [Schinkia azotoformans MEV2011]|uniref:Uncharacterized protein n=1 Tax=Schinkia azotoformans MEV2011 TaxID=1348973 RepID=A0A072NK31_SCHAZ|nr:hypothetical protein [Schinkia azotoformans]KEF38049.1 hypothetical protein M670_02808 [Schinkia azotoformans MEV2011]MEC1695783.1 hypothetical protein [Schinkia azotoformans]MEC1725106.1 hypothetical protein [Schinkia azotoformans]MEC1769766.1 hypothetical protein [Schinkia azotoformans]MEC1779317.1 hypothetical protein [Schinkia azotoformans]